VWREKREQRERESRLISRLLSSSPREREQPSKSDDKQFSSLVLEYKQYTAAVVVAGNRDDVYYSMSPVIQA
jgi:hypothetical protein